MTRRPHTLYLCAACGGATLLGPDATQGLADLIDIPDEFRIQAFVVCAECRGSPFAMWPRRLRVAAPEAVSRMVNH